jgi:hypothetical protein
MTDIELITAEELEELKHYLAIGAMFLTNEIREIRKTLR